ncbi:MAG: hypothetical protein K6G62_02115 [Eubacterium sp.]|nr:hypothetical protein [Eubacterium sp.]
MKWKNISVTDSAGQVLFEGPFNELPVKEDYIIEKSTELYSEPEPCIIYRTHILKKLYLDLMDQFEGKPKKGMSIDLGLCPDLTDHLDLSGQGKSLEIL